MMPRKFKDGDRFERLVIIQAYIEKRRRCSWYHLVQCDCGTQKIVDGCDLSTGHIKSCGCLSKEIRKTHNMSNDPEYKVWASMIQRCSNPNSRSAKNYLERGIKVCERWHSFENFFEDMGKRPEPKYTLERVDNDGDYQPDNCMWADRSAQSINQRIRKDNTTGHKGVYYKKSEDRYFSSISRDKHRVFLGFFDTKEEAIIARKTAEQNYLDRGSIL